MSSDYQIKMDHAQTCEQTIARFRAIDDPEGHPGRHNFAAKAQREWQDVVRAYQEAFEIYRDFNQREKAADLLENLLDLVQTCDVFTSSLALQLLISLESSHKWLEQVSSGAKERIKSALKVTIGQKSLEKEMEYWLLLRALDVLRDLAAEEQERKAIDVSICQTMELGAQVCFRRGNLDNAEGWYRDAARIAQDRVGDTEWASRLLQIAASVQRIRAARTTVPASVQAAHSESPSRKENTEATQQLDISESLEIVLHKALEEQHAERFLPPLEDFITDYEAEEDQLSKLLNDERLLPDKTAIEAREAAFRGKGLAAWLPTRFVDAQGNPRGEFEASVRFTIQYIVEIAEIIEALFSVWQDQGHLTEARLAQFLNQNAPYYDWTIYTAGLSQHFQSDFICSTHTLVPQFENVVRISAQNAGIDIKKFKSGIPGDILLNDLINPGNAEMRAFLGEGLFDLIYSYLLNSSNPFSYRHKIAHGWIAPTECNFQLSAMIIWLTLKVVAGTSRPE